MPPLSFFVHRLTRALMTLWIVVTVVFVILRLSGDPVALLLPEDAPPEQVEALRAQLGLDAPIFVQYVRYWVALTQGDLGQSLRYRQPAVPLVLERWPATFELGATAFALAVSIGLSVGILAALVHRSAWDRLLMALMSVVQSAPSFCIAIVLILLFVVHLRWLPSSGRGSVTQLVLPAVTLAAFTLASLARLTRATLIDVLRTDYVRTAHAKGLPLPLIVRRHALRNASLPLVTFLGLELGGLLTGAVIVEMVFAWPGVGRLAVDAVASRDYPVVQAAVLVIVAVFVLLNVVVDCAYAAFDPRVRRG